MTLGESAAAPVGTGRSWLYVPGDRPERVAKALGSGADAVIVDLEDAVRLDAKDDARSTAAGLLAAPADDGVERWVRVNQGQRGLDDVAALAGQPGLSGLVVPKASSRWLAEVAAAGAGTPLLALVESAVAVLELPAVARADDVVALAMGEVDLAADLRVEPSPTGEELWPVRSSVVVASAAAGCLPPVGPVWVAVRDLDGLTASTVELRRRGFGARQVIHPAQVEPVNAAFTPGTEEVERAEATLAAAEAAPGGAWVDAEGRMVDEAVLRSARRTVELARRRRA